MRTDHKFIALLALVALTLCCCLVFNPAARHGAEPTPTRTMAEGIIELAKICRTPTGRALMNNIMWFHFKDEQWTARPRDSEWDWLVQFHGTLNGQQYSASWSYRVDLNQLTPLDYEGRFLFNNP